MFQKLTLSKSKIHIADAAGSLFRVYEHTLKRNVGAISAFRGEFDFSTNKQRNQSLAIDIRGAGYGFIKC